MNDNLKIFVTGPACSNIGGFTKFLQYSLPDTFSYGKLTTNNSDCKEDRQYFNNLQISEIFINRQFVFLHDGTGLTTVTFEENNLFSVSIEELVLIPNKIWHKYNILVVVLSDDDIWGNGIYSIRDQDVELQKTMIHERSLLEHFNEVLDNVNFMDMRGYTILEGFARIVKFTESESQKIHKKLIDTEFPVFRCY